MTALISTGVLPLSSAPNWYDISATAKCARSVQKHQLATELVTRHVRGLIVTGHLRRGQRLPPERELVRTVGVSRTSVRAGLQSLAAKGVVVIRHGAGTFVADGPPMLDSEPLSFLAALHGFTRREMFEARRTLEVGIAGFAADRATDADLAAISDEVTGMFATLDDAQAFLLHDIRFHRAVGDRVGQSDSRVDRRDGVGDLLRTAAADRQPRARSTARRRNAPAHLSGHPRAQSWRWRSR